MTTSADHPPLLLDGSELTIAEVESVARDGRAVTLSEQARRRIERARQIVDKTTAGSEAVYGINTGFGSLSRQRISREDLQQVQRNLIRSHAAGVGDPLARDTVRAMLLIQAASLVRGHSGVRVELIELILDLLNSNITPVVPSRGSVGASGDLAPLAHASLVMIGEGEAVLPDGSVRPGGEALHAAGLTPVTLQTKEGLALINGTHLMTAMGSLTLADLQRLQHAALVSAAMAIDANRGSDSPLDPRVHAVRGQLGQETVASMLRALLRGSQIGISHKVNDPRVQDPYCLRATPQVLGSVWDTIEHVRTIFGRELAAVTDNPLVFHPDDPPELVERGETSNVPTSSVVSGGNFHGLPLALALDSLKIAMCHLAGIAERRIYWLLAASDSENPLNTYLSPQPGLHSGLMIVQYTAAACCNELQTLCTPASVANIPTSAGMEDYNSMGATAAHQARASVDLATNVIAIELLVMAEALEYQRPHRSGDAIEQAHAIIREVVPKLTEDRPPSPDINAIADLIRSGRFERTLAQ